MQSGDDRMAWRDKPKMQLENGDTAYICKTPAQKW